MLLMLALFSIKVPMTLPPSVLCLAPTLDSVGHLMGFAWIPRAPRAAASVKIATSSMASRTSHPGSPVSSFAALSPSYPAALRAGLPGLVLAPASGAHPDIAPSMEPRPPSEPVTSSSIVGVRMARCSKHRPGVNLFFVPQGSHWHPASAVRYRFAELISSSHRSIADRRVRLASGTRRATSNPSAASARWRFMCSSHIVCISRS